MDWIILGLAAGLLLTNAELIRLWYRTRREQRRLDAIEQRVGQLMVIADKVWK